MKAGCNRSAPSLPLRLLIVDDEPAIREILSVLLANEGHQVDTAANGADALKKLEIARWDIVLTDRAMPVMGGDELAARIKSTYPSVPVILLTGYAGPAEPVGPFARMIDCVVKKPFTIAELRAGIEQVWALAGAKVGCGGN